MVKDNNLVYKKKKHANFANVIMPCIIEPEY